MATEIKSDKNLLARLNDAQVEAVCQVWGPSLVVAGAGSGKTTVLTRRIAYLLTELKQDPYSVLAVTFTNKAAQEMLGRVETIVGKDMARMLSIGTFHSICARILRREIESYKTKQGWQWSSNFVIYDETDSNNVMKAQIKKLDLDEKVFNPKEMKFAISALKNDGYSYELYASEATTYREIKLASIFEAYQSALARNNALDFDDLIALFLELLKNNQEVRQRLKERFRHVLVDEFQDTNKAQYEMVRLLTYQEAADEKSATRLWRNRSLLVVGDVDQSIYSWRKADYRIFLGFQKDYKGARLIKLEENYRSTATILEVANSIIENNTERIEKVLRCNKSKGSRAQYYEAVDEIDEAFYVVEELKRLKARGRALNDCVILYRTNAQSRAIEEVLIRNDMPYKVVGGTRFYDRQEIKDMVAYLKLVFNPKDGQAFNRVVNTPKRGLGKTTLDRLNAYAQKRDVSNIEAARDAQFIGNLSARAVSALKEFAYQVRERWSNQASSKEQNPVSGLIELILNDTKYIQQLEEQALSSKDELAYGRIENIREFLAVAKEFEEIAEKPDLDSFLTRISLVSDLDQVDLGDDAIKLMTLHSAKGLEFPVVFLIGLEDGLFPHSRSFDDATSMEEERRLMYVGVTRAGDLLYLTRARRRTIFARGGPNASGFQTSATIASR
ncbi:MAG: UvrD-helicase domain-containing protein, partial [Candidatus Obscuribacterales bacterium]|nr:UvrD-helicase domain-containing protein [Candidatus Obscuribacterales bacterium]